MIIKLQNGIETVIDDKDFEKIKGYKWIYGVGNRYVGANVYNKGNRKQILLHRFIMSTPKGLHTDHINGNKLDNRKCNLRICTPSQNQMNSRKNITKSSKYKGVSWFKRDSCWRAYISTKGKQFHLGYFKSEKNAAKAYNKKARKLFGIYSFLNKV